MKANELMIDDWVYNCIADIRFQVYPQFFSQWHNRSEQFGATIQPISLTPEILEKNGFKLDKEDGWWWLTPKIGITFWEEDDVELEFENKNSSVNIHIKYVHQLQHALRLCGIDKTIEL